MFLKCLAGHFRLWIVPLQDPMRSHTTEKRRRMIAILQQHEIYFEGKKLLHE